MAIAMTLRSCVILAGLAFAASMPITSGTARSAPIEPPRHEVLEALAKAHAAVQRKQSKAALDEIERAEVALLNLGQLDQDPATEQALKQLAAARTAIQQKDLKAADTLLAGAAHDLTGVTGAPPAVGEVVYNRENERIGPVIEVVVAPDGQVADIVIDVGGYLGSGDKNVLIPVNDIRTDPRPLTLDRTRAQIRQAANYRP
jgi:hypothetical protein